MNLTLELLSILLLSQNVGAQTTWTVTPPQWVLDGNGISYNSEASCESAAQTMVAGTYHCTSNNQSVIVGVAAPPPVCTSPQPSPVTQVEACPTGTTGTWTQTATFAAAPYPTCWVQGPFLPTSPPAGACTVIPPPPTCAQGSGSFTTTGIFDTKTYGNYIVRNNNWGGTAGQKFWSNSADCWGVTTTAKSEINSIGSYPSVTRGWSQAGMPNNAWTVNSGMGVQVSALTKAKVHWGFTAPTSSARWLGLMDIYFHATNNPGSGAFPPLIDLMVDQRIIDNGYYASVAKGDHATNVTIGGVTYLVFVDDTSDGENSFHSSGGHTIHLFQAPASGTVWGVADGVTDVAAIVKYFGQSAPVDDAGKPLLNAKGVAVTAPLIPSSVYLNAVNAGWEIDFGTAFTNTAFCVSMQNEADCP